LLSDDRITAVLDGRIADEYRRVCAEPRLHLDAEAVRDFLRYLDDFAENVTAMPLKTELPDPNDVPFLDMLRESSSATYRRGTIGAGPRPCSRSRQSSIKSVRFPVWGALLRHAGMR
jgi:hypothetical protein